MFYHISEDTLIILQTTVPPGTTKLKVYPLLKNIVNQRRLNLNKFFLAHSYERVMPGENYLDSIINYWRVYSGIDRISSSKCRKFFQKIINFKKFPMTEVKNTTESELAKVLENSYRANNIAFINEWSQFSQEIGVDLFRVIDAIKIRPSHSNIRFPGLGVGGYCLTKDPLFAKISAKKIFKLKNHEFPFSTRSIEVNNQMPISIFFKIKKLLNHKIDNKKFLLMGVSYRHNIDDTRNSPTEKLYNKIIKYNAKIFVNDPVVKYWSEKKIIPDNKILDFKEIDIIIFCVSHDSYKKINFLKKLINVKSIIIYDANNVLSKKQIIQIKNMINKNKKIQFFSEGRGNE